MAGPFADLFLAGPRKTEADGPAHQIAASVPKQGAAMQAATENRP